MADYHKMIRDAVVTTLEGAAVGVPVYPSDKLDFANVSAPAVVVAAVGPEQNRGEMSTNAQDGIGYPVAVALLLAGTDRGEKSPDAPELTDFRRTLRTLFNNRRLAGVAQVGWCEINDSGPLFDPKDPSFQKVSTAMVVTAVGRFPRT